MSQGGRGKTDGDGCGVNVDFKRDLVIKIRVTQRPGPMRWMRRVRHRVDLFEV